MDVIANVQQKRQQEFEPLHVIDPVPWDLNPHGKIYEEKNQGDAPKELRG